MDTIESSEIEPNNTIPIKTTTNNNKNENELTVIPDSIENENKTQEQQQVNKKEMNEENDKIDENNTNTNKLFSNITYYIINTSKTDIDKLLDDNGAKQDKYLGDFVTHVICDEFSTDNFDCNEAKDVFELKIVKSDWVFKCLYANSLLP
jgi:hypothetical protein